MDGSAVAEARHAVQRAVAARLNVGLRRDPERHGEVLDALRAHRVADDFPYDVLNRHLARDLAVLYASAPYADTSALVSARRIRSRAVVVDVVSHSLEGKRGIDPSADRVAGEYLARRHEVAGPPGDFDWEAIGRFCEEGLRAVDAWVEEAGAYRTVYSRTMWPASHVLAALVATRWPGTRWIAEFSDPQQWNPYGTRREPAAEDDALWQELAAALRARGTAPPEDRNIGHLVELLAYALADEVVFTNDRQKEFMLGYLQEQDLVPAIEAKAVVSRHPTLPTEFYDLVDSDYRPPAGRVNVGYFGAFYPTRGLREVLGALERLGDGERDKVRLHIFTPRPKRTRRRLQEFGLRGRVRVRPAVDYLESLRLTRMVDVLLVNDANTRESYPCNPYLPSKWSDYVGSGTDIWAVVEEGSVLSDMDVKYRSVLGDVDGALGQLRRMIAERAGVAGGYEPHPSGATRRVTPDVTVLIPTFQGAGTIGRALQALAGQSLDPGRFEVLVVANGPPCETPSIVQRFRSEHPARPSTYGWSRPRRPVPRTPGTSACPRRAESTSPSWTTTTGCRPGSWRVCSTSPSPASCRWPSSWTSVRRPTGR